ncbi:MAG TPA: nucleotide exchange factor GrpE, partial [Candidatus Polarisedimenticolia bacterium]|nr:nucleotide exchange factor GrpE [Candidatus Polarisedimenticolia bacterium]
RRHHASEPGEAAADERSPYPSFVEELRQRAESAEKVARDAMRRAEAEIDAVRERLQRDVERRVLQGKASLVASVLEVIDNLERAGRAASDTAPSVGQGILLIHQQMQAILKAEGVEPIETLGLPYDPEVAEAIQVETVEPERDNQVIEEIQRGYRWGETILRPARVRVGKASTG